MKNKISFRLYNLLFLPVLFLLLPVFVVAFSSLGLSASASDNQHCPNGSNTTINANTTQSNQAPHHDAYLSTLSSARQISTRAQLVEFANDVNGFGTAPTSFAGQTITLTANINMLGEEGGNFTPIGTADNPFRGTFDGGFFVVYNLSVNNSSSDNVGLFGNISLGGAVANLGVEGQITGRHSVGGIVGRINGGSIQNSFFNGTVQGQINVGGIAGEIIETDILNTYTRGQIIGGSNVGGVAGRVDNANTFFVSNNFSLSSVAAGTGVGGVVGQASGSILNIIALNPSVILNPPILPPAPVGRVFANLSTGSANHIFAYDGILNPSNTLTWPNVGISSADGQSVPAEDIFDPAFWTGERWGVARQWDSSVWSFSQHELPILIGFDTQFQTRSVPHIQINIEGESFDVLLKNNSGNNRFIFDRQDIFESQIFANLAQFVTIDWTDGDRKLVLETEFDICPNWILDSTIDRTNSSQSAILLPVIGIGQFRGRVEVEFFIDPRPMTIDNIIQTKSEFVFSGLVQNPQNYFSVKDGDFVDFVFDTDYKLDLNNSIIVGEFDFNIEFIGNYIGSLDIPYTIVRANGTANASIADWTFGDDTAAASFPLPQTNSILSSFDQSVRADLAADLAAPAFEFRPLGSMGAWSNFSTPPTNAGRYEFRAVFAQSTNINAFFSQV
ncbi:MAG: hypothetical protein FWD86_03045, partial [Firmicutes bacterium]|nr:hypothetical protein [Bacillota bacterium]